jgi:hypothetical protein
MLLDDALVDPEHLSLVEVDRSQRRAGRMLPKWAIRGVGGIAILLGISSAPRISADAAVMRSGRRRPPRARLRASLKPYTFDQEETP